MDLTPEVVFSLIQSDEKFPIDFDDAWRWIGYSRKDTAKRALTKNFVEKVDFHISAESDNHEGLSPQEKAATTKEEDINLTSECFKSFCVMAGTVRGKQARRYFLNCEAELKRRIKEEQEQNQSNTKKRLVGSIVSKDIVSRYPKFDDEFYELLYKKRGNGWENRDPKKRPACVANWTNTVVYDRLYPLRQ